MTDSLDRTLAERFAAQHDELPAPDFADVLRRTRVRQPPRSWRRQTRVVLVAAVLAIAAVGAATAFAVRSLTQSPVTQGFSALTDPALPEVTASTVGISPHLAGVLREVMGPGYVARQVGPGMYLGQRGNALCEVVDPGAAGCTDHLDGDVWLLGDMMRAYDAETAPFRVHFYGFARDDVATVRVTTSDGTVTTVPVEHNAFETTLKNTSFADIRAVEVVSTSGQTTAIDPRTYFPATLPSFTVTTP